MAAERQSEAPFGGKACPESPAPAGHSGRALRLHGSGAVGASPRPCCATPGGLCPPSGRAPPPPRSVWVASAPPARAFARPRRAASAAGGSAPPAAASALWSEGRGGACCAPVGGGGCPLWGALRGWGGSPAPATSPPPASALRPVCAALGRSVHLAPYRGETTSVSPAPCRARRPVGHHDVNRRKGLAAPLAAGQ